MSDDDRLDQTQAAWEGLGRSFRGVVRDRLAAVSPLSLGDLDALLQLAHGVLSLEQRALCFAAQVEYDRANFPGRDAD